MLDESYILFSFNNFDGPAQALDQLKNFQKARLIPLPPEIDAGCGHSLRILAKDLNKALEILDKDSYDRIFIMKRDPNNKRIIEEYVL